MFGCFFPLSAQAVHTFSTMRLTEFHSTNTLTPPLHLLFYMSLLSNDILFVLAFPCSCTWLKSRDVWFSDVASPFHFSLKSCSIKKTNTEWVCWYPTFLGSAVSIHMTSLNLFLFRTRKENNGEGTAGPGVHYSLSNARIRQVVCQYFASRMHSSLSKFPSLTQQLTTCQVGNYANVY